MAIKMTQLVHDLLKDHVKMGDTVIDATCGKGNDTVFLSTLVGENGCVHTYDIQELALTYLQSQPLYNAKNTVFHLASHETLNCQTSTTCVFNFGYLPGGNHAITTTASSSVLGVKSALASIKSNGLVVLTIYPGHPAGLEESIALDALIATLPIVEFSITKYENTDIPNCPYVYAIQKTKKSTL